MEKTPTRTPTRARNLEELLPELEAILTPEGVAFLSAKRGARLSPQPTTSKSAEPSVQDNKPKSPARDGQKTAKKKLSFPKPKQNAAANRATGVPVVSNFLNPQYESKAVYGTSDWRNIYHENKCDALTEESRTNQEESRIVTVKHYTPVKAHRNFPDNLIQCQRHQDTMSFDKTLSFEDEDTTTEETTVTNSNQDLSALAMKVENNLKMTDNVIEIFSCMLDNQIESLQHIRQLIRERCQTNATTGNNSEDDNED